MDRANKGVAIVKSDSTDYTGIKQIYVGGAGNLVVRLRRSPETTLTLTAVIVGRVYKLEVSRVMDATTATALVGFY